MNDKRTGYPDWYPQPKAGQGPRHPDQRIVAFIGAPGSGKSTLAQSFDPNLGWVTITLDDLRQTLWPPHRRVYWDVRGSDPAIGRAAQRLLHAVNQTALDVALYEGFNVVLPDTHIRPSAFKGELEIAAKHGIAIEWKLFDVPWEELLRRNRARGLMDFAHRVPDDVLSSAFDELWSADAWWRDLPTQQLEIITQKTELAA